ncbi:hypothetical protein EGM70_17365 [Enterobacteriaceae bacterium 89]|nr:hypothetical protein [Enterobacteriaceae bacterium 89]
MEKLTTARAATSRSRFRASWVSASDSEVLNNEEPAGSFFYDVLADENLAMSHFILSDDIFLSTAVANIIRRIPVNRPLCIIDIASFSSLRDINNAMNKTGVTEQYRFIFIGGSCVLSKVLKPLVTLGRNASLAEFSAKVKNRKASTLLTVLMHFDRYRRLRMLTPLQRLTVYGLMHHADIALAASFIRISQKTVYSCTRQIGIKLNLSSTLHVKQFLYAEFTEEERRNLLPSPFRERVKGNW